MLLHFCTTKPTNKKYRFISPQQHTNSSSADFEKKRKFQSYKAEGEEENGKLYQKAIFISIGENNHETTIANRLEKTAASRHQECDFI